MDTSKLGVVKWLDNDEVEFCDEDFMAFLYEGMMKFLNKNNKDDFNVDFLLEHPME